MGLMFPEGARTAAEASGGTSDPLANPCPPVLARKVLRFSLETWWWGVTIAGWLLLLAGLGGGGV